MNFQWYTAAEQLSVISNAAFPSRTMVKTMSYTDQLWTVEMNLVSCEHKESKNCKSKKRQILTRFWRLSMCFSLIHHSWSVLSAQKKKKKQMLYTKYTSYITLCSRWQSCGVESNVWSKSEEREERENNWEQNEDRGKTEHKLNVET